MKRSLFLLLLVSHCAFSQQVPTFEQVISLRSVGNVVLSPDGKSAVYTVQTTDWDNNRYDTELWMWREGSEPFQLTNNVRNNSMAEPIKERR